MTAPGDAMKERGLSIGELRYLANEGPLWWGLTKRGESDPDIAASEQAGLIMKNPHGEGWVITQRGRALIEHNAVCPTCGQALPPPPVTP